MNLKLLWVLILLLAGSAMAQSNSKSLEEHLNFVVGGVWASQNKNNDGKPESFNSFHMNFENWSSKSSVRGEIFGVTNNGDTVALIQIWNYINPSQNNIFLTQRTSWGETGIGTIVPYKEKHLDIQFKSVTSEGQEYFTRDIHYVLSKNEMRAETYQKSKVTDEWQKTGESIWVRSKN
ncbi:MAG: hypothetical protein RIF39_08435 [Cyclobacteriaceae bacterium]